METDGGDRAEGRPSRSPLMEDLTEDELSCELIDLAPCVLAEIPRLILLAFIFVGGVFCSVYFPRTIVTLQGAFLPFPLRIPLGLLPAVSFALKIAYDLGNERYTIAEHYVRSVRGLLWFSKSDRRVKAHDVREVDIRRSLFGRMVNTGHIVVGSAVTSDTPFQMRGIYNPSLFRDIMLERAERELQRISHADQIHPRDSRYPVVR